MRPVLESEVMDLTSYEKVRSERRARVIQLRSARRVRMLECLSLVFENHETVLYQIQEMVRAERMVAQAAIQHEIETYNQLMPGPAELSATLFIEVAAQGQIREVLESFLGLDSGNHLWMDLGPEGRAPARFEEGHSEEGKISAVQYVRFSLSPAQVARFRDPEQRVELVLEHPNHEARVALEGAVRLELKSDIED